MKAAIDSYGGVRGGQVAVVKLIGAQSHHEKAYNVRNAGSQQSYP